MIEAARDAWHIARKDLSIELRVRSTFLSALVFALLAIVVLYFAWDPTAVRAADLAPGVLWVVFTFSGLLGLNRSFALEHADRALDGLLAAPVAREAIFVGKALANLVFVGCVQLVAIPAVVVFYGVPLGEVAGRLALVALLATVGLVVVGTLFAAMASNTRMAELLLPVLSLPFFVPIVIPAAQATLRLVERPERAEIGPWVKLLLAFDLIFGMVCTMIYPFTLEE